MTTLAIDFTDKQFQADSIPAKTRTIREAMDQLDSLYTVINDALRNDIDNRPQIHNPEDAAALLRPFLSAKDHEEFWVILCDARNRVLRMVKLYVGSLAEISSIRVSEIFRDAIVEQAYGILLAHNHPSGDPTPSPEDVGMTRKVDNAGKLLDIAVLDHIIIGSGKRFISLQQQGLIHEKGF